MANSLSPRAHHFPHHDEQGEHFMHRTREAPTDLDGRAARCAWPRRRTKSQPDSPYRRGDGCEFERLMVVESSG